MFIYVVALFLILHYHVESNDMVFDPDKFGPYYVTVQEFTACKGPKAVDVAAFYTNVTKQKNSYIGFLNVTILADTRLEKMRINVYSMKNNVKNALWNYISSSPCKNFAASGVIEKCFKTTNCFVKKGSYTTSIDFNDVTYHFNGQKFFYGTYVAKTHIVSKNANIFCALCTMTIHKV